MLDRAVNYLLPIKCYTSISCAEIIYVTKQTKVEERARRIVRGRAQYFMTTRSILCTSRTQWVFDASVPRRGVELRKYEVPSLAE